jgi:hypothetical protein
MNTIPMAPIWAEREPMIKCWTKKFFEQKLNYIHFNPCQPHWNTTDRPKNYNYSSAGFYESGVKNFVFLKHFLTIPDNINCE